MECCSVGNRTTVRQTTTIELFVCCRSIASILLLTSVLLSVCSVVCLLLFLFSGIALVYFLVFWSLRPQVVGLGGSRGLYPVNLLLHRIRMDVESIETKKERVSAFTSTSTSTPLTFRPSTWRSTLRRWCWFPTLLWFDCSDRTLAALPLFGLLCASLSFLCGGIVARVSLLCCWIVFLSLATTLSEFMSYPWDCLLLESSFLAIWLPTMKPMIDIAAVFGSSSTVDAWTSPSRSLVWMFHWLVFRLMFGMGKKKFIGQALAIVNDTSVAVAGSKKLATSSSNLTYLRWFLMWQPLPTPIASMLFRRLPSLVFAIGLVVMFLLEMVLPFFIFCPTQAPSVLWLTPYEWKMTMAIGTIALQFGIASMGNYGCFNLLTAILSITLLESGGESSINHATVDRSFNLMGLAQVAVGWFSFLFTDVLSFSQLPSLFDMFALVLFIGALLHLPFDSYFSCSFLHSPVPSQQFPYTMLPRSMLAFFRALAPFRLIHAYGVFGVSVPQHDQKIIIIRSTNDTAASREEQQVEGESQSADSSNSSTSKLHHQQEWRQYTYRYLASHTRQRLPFIAPLQPRIDHQLYYEGLKQRACFYNYHNPYNFSRYTFLDRLCQRLLEGEPSVLALLGDNGATISGNGSTLASPPTVTPGPAAMISVQRYSFVFQQQYEQEVKEQNARMQVAQSNVGWSTSTSSAVSPASTETATSVSSRPLSGAALNDALLAHRRSFELEMLEPRRSSPPASSPHPHLDTSDSIDLPADNNTWHRMFIEHLPPQSSMRKTELHASGAFTSAELACYHVHDPSVFVLPEPHQFFWTHHAWRRRMGVD